jgi:hypothetical protein
MIAFDVLVLDELRDRAAKMRLAKRDHLLQTFRLD